MSRNRTIGEKGEKIALDYLVKEGYEVLEKNWTSGHKEVDIITRKDDVYVFFEIKTRTSLTQGLPEDSISKAKMRNVTGAAQIYLMDKKYKDVRFDVIAIYLPEHGDMDFMHFRDAFY